MPASNSASSFALHHQLARDTIPLGALALSQILLMDDSRFPWLILVPRRAGITEVIDLAPDERGQLMTEIAAVAEALRAETRCDKLNIAAIGNMGPQLHVHIVARFRSDAAWPKPVWGQGTAIPYADVARDALLARLRP